MRVLHVVGGRHARRAALRGLLAVAGASAITSGLDSLRRRSASSSRPTGRAAAAAAFATAVSMELPLAAAPLGALAAAVAYSGVRKGAQSPRAAAVGVAIGIGVAGATVKVWPRIDASPAATRPVPRAWARVVGEPSTDGAGLTVVVNPTARSGRGDNPTETLRAALPAAQVVELGDGDDLVQTLHDAAAAPDSRAIGIVGGDGSINAAVGVALEHGCPLVVLPGGTLNHFARDLGLESLDDAVRAVRDGQLVAVDVGTIDGRPFVNTASLGSYSKLVEAREKYEATIGKWPALIVALGRVLRDTDPLEVTIDGRVRRIWMVFVGNCAYEPPGFAPATRTRLDDGLLDVRIVDGADAWARVRFVVAALTGNLVRSPIYTRNLVPTLTVTTPPGADLLAADGEVFHGHSDFVIGKDPRRLLVYVPE